MGQGRGGFHSVATAEHVDLLGIVGAIESHGSHGPPALVGFGVELVGVGKLYRQVEVYHHAGWVFLQKRLYPAVEILELRLSEDEIAGAGGTDPPSVGLQLPCTLASAHLASALLLATILTKISRLPVHLNAAQIFLGVADKAAVLRRSREPGRKKNREQSEYGEQSRMADGIFHDGLIISRNATNRPFAKAEISGSEPAHMAIKQGDLRSVRILRDMDCARCGNSLHKVPMFDLPAKVREFACMCCGERFWTVEGSVGLISNPFDLELVLKKELALEASLLPRN